MSSTPSTLQKRAREVEDDDEEEMVAAIVAYCDHVAQHQHHFAKLQASCEAVIHCYVKHRGGMQEIRLFEIPEKPEDFVFDMDAIDEKQFVHDFRFTHAQFDRVVLALLSHNFPPVIRTRARDTCPLGEALAMMCMKYAWPTRLGSMVKLFRSSTSRMSRIVSQLRRLLYDSFSGALRNPRILSLPELECFSAAVTRKSGVCTHVFGFIDATVRPTTKPKHLQAAVYNGKDRVHALKYHALVIPNGIIHQLAGPWPGSRHDMHLLSQANLKQHLRELPTDADDRMFSVYADQGYAESPGIRTPFFDGLINPAHEIHNQVMASSRIAVEWAFGDIIVQWASLDMRSTQQLLSNRKIGQVYIVAGLLSNLFTCLQGNRGSKYFGLRPPSLEEYMSSLKQNNEHQ